MNNSTNLPLYNMNTNNVPILYPGKPDYIATCLDLLGNFKWTKPSDIINLNLNIESENTNRITVTKTIETDNIDYKINIPDDCILKNLSLLDVGNLKYSGQLTSQENFLLTALDAAGNTAYKSINDLIRIQNTDLNINITNPAISPSEPNTYLYTMNLESKITIDEVNTTDLNVTGLANISEANITDLTANTINAVNLGVVNFTFDTLNVGGSLLSSYIGKVFRNLTCTSFHSPKLILYGSQYSTYLSSRTIAIYDEVEKNFTSYHIEVTNDINFCSNVVGNIICFVTAAGIYSLDISTRIATLRLAGNFVVISELYDGTGTHVGWLFMNNAYSWYRMNTSYSITVIGILPGIDYFNQTSTQLVCGNDKYTYWTTYFGTTRFGYYDVVNNTFVQIFGNVIRGICLFAWNEGIIFYRYSQTLAYYVNGVQQWIISTGIANDSNVARVVYFDGWLYFTGQTTSKIWRINFDKKERVLSESFSSSDQLYTVGNKLFLGYREFVEYDLFRFNPNSSVYINTPYSNVSYLSYGTSVAQQLWYHSSYSSSWVSVYLNAGSWFMKLVRQDGLSLTTIGGGILNSGVNIRYNFGQNGIISYFHYTDKTGSYSSTCYILENRSYNSYSLTTFPSSSYQANFICNYNPKDGRRGLFILYEDNTYSYFFNSSLSAKIPLQSNGSNDFYEVACNFREYIILYSPVTYSLYMLDPENDSIVANYPFNLTINVQTLTMCYHENSKTLIGFFQVGIVVYLFRLGVRFEIIAFTNNYSGSIFPPNKLRVIEDMLYFFKGDYLTGDIFSCMVNNFISDPTYYNISIETVFPTDNIKIGHRIFRQVSSTPTFNYYSN